MLPTPLVWIIARPYVAGDSLQKALIKADQLWTDKKIMSTVDLLGEDVKTTDEVEEMVQIYLTLLNGLKDKAEYVTVSLKLKPKYDNIATVLQTRLFRTEQDIKNLPPHSQIRLCIGIYNEPKDIALQKKSEMKEKLYSYVEPLHDQGHFIGVATHDEPTVRKILELTEKKQITPKGMEFQFLLGVPREKLHQEIQAKGFNVRQYVPFATKKKYATAYALRRFDENPHMAIYVLNNLSRQRWFQVLVALGIFVVMLLLAFITHII